VFFRSFFLLFALSFLFFVTLSAERVILSAVEGRRAFSKKTKKDAAAIRARALNSTTTINQNLCASATLRGNNDISQSRRGAKKTYVQIIITELCIQFKREKT
jgi:hypothetical protein